MTRNELKTEAKWTIIDKLEEGYDGYLCDLHNEVFNMEMYEPYTDRAIKILDELGGYSVVAEVIKYEEDNFGQTSADKYDNPCWVLSMFWYMVGQEAMTELFEDCSRWDELWDTELTTEDGEYLVNYAKKIMLEEDL